MTNIVTQNPPNREGWIQQLAAVVTDPIQLLKMLELEHLPELQKGAAARQLFALRVPLPFIARMKKGDARDPLLLQVLTQSAEFILSPGYSHDPLDEQQPAVPGLLHKYHNRALLMVKTGCAINCRYCFRRHFPYQHNQGNKYNWTQALDYIAAHPELEEIIFSGGDPLMAKDTELSWLISRLEAIPHLKRLRIHTRLPVVIPERITETLVQILRQCSLQVVMVTHINHAQEIDLALTEVMCRLKMADVTLLNQSVLLKGVNDTADSLAELSNQLFSIGIMPYYLNVLDKVQGAAHFLVDDNQARQLIHQLLAKLSGFLVPKLIREVAGATSKTPIDLRLPQQ